MLTLHVDVNLRLTLPTLIKIANTGPDSLKAKSIGRRSEKGARLKAKDKEEAEALDERTGKWVNQGCTEAFPKRD